MMLSEVPKKDAIDVMPKKTDAATSEDIWVDDEEEFLSPEAVDAVAAVARAQAPAQVEEERVRSLGQGSLKTSLSGSPARLTSDSSKLVLPALLSLICLCSALVKLL